MEMLQKAINTISPLSKESWAIFLNAWKHWPVPKDYFLVREHSVSDYIYFIEKGGARLYGEIPGQLRFFNIAFASSIYSAKLIP